MNWDEFGDDDFEAGETGEQGFVPDGTHVAKILWAGIQKKDWAKNDRNPEGKLLAVKLEVSARYKPVWESIPCFSPPMSMSPPLERMNRARPAKMMKPSASFHMMSLLRRK
jgi:hypothetical protein